MFPARTSTKSFDENKAYTQNLLAGFSVQRNYLSGTESVRLAVLSFGSLEFQEQVESMVSIR